MVGKSTRKPEVIFQLVDNNGSQTVEGYGGMFCCIQSGLDEADDHELLVYEDATRTREDPHLHD